VWLLRVQYDRGLEIHKYKQCSAAGEISRTLPSIRQRIKAQNRLKNWQWRFRGFILKKTSFSIAEGEGRVLTRRIQKPLNKSVPWSPMERSTSTSSMSPVEHRHPGCHVAERKLQNTLSLLLFFSSKCYTATPLQHRQKISENFNNKSQFQDQWSRCRQETPEKRERGKRNKGGPRSDTLQESNYCKLLTVYSILL